MRFNQVYDTLQNLTGREINQAELGRVLGQSRSNINYKKKANVLLSDEDVKKIETYYRIDLTENKKMTADVIRNLIVGTDRIEINYWSDLPEELKNPKIKSVWFDKEVVENAWGMKAEDLCIVPMVGDSLTNYWYPIRNGDILIINTQIEDIRGNGVYFGTSQNNTRFWIREMQILMDMSIEFKSFSPSGNVNKTYSAQQLEEVDFKLIGKVIKNVSFRL